MVSILGIMGSGISFCFAPASGALRDRFGGRQMLIYTGLLGMATPFTYAAFPGVFWIVMAWSTWGPVMAGLAAASQYALGMDVLPVDEHGRPTNAGRDQSIAMTNFILPSAVMPAVLGWWLTQFTSHTEGFRYFFLIGGLVNLSQTGLFWACVHPLEEPLDRACQCTRHRFRGRPEHDLKRRKKMETEAQVAINEKVAAQGNPYEMPGQQRSTRSLQSDLMQQYSGDYRGSDLQTRLV